MDVAKAEQKIGCLVPKIKTAILNEKLKLIQDHVKQLPNGKDLYENTGRFGCDIDSNIKDLNQVYSLYNNYKRKRYIIFVIDTTDVKYTITNILKYSFKLHTSTISIKD